MDSADDETLLIWAENILGAQTIDEVFAPMTTGPRDAYGVHASKMASGPAVFGGYEGELVAD